ncbi:MAG: dihydrodipicolinate synthase family protein [Vicinamibacterales bacterium]
MTLAGLYHPLVTPFTASGDVDTPAIARNAAAYLSTPLTGLVVLGSNGESPQLDDDESDRVIEAVREVVPASRPLLAGAARESTRGTIGACRRAGALGVTAVMVRTPSFYKNMMTTETFVRHYTEVADASPVPVLLYNVTMYTGVTLHPDAVGKLSQHPNIVGLKESGNDLQLLATTCPPRRTGSWCSAAPPRRSIRRSRLARTAACWHSPASCPSAART